jgi:P-type conjugative transfer protein TrbJ
MPRHFSPLHRALIVAVILGVPAAPPAFAGSATGGATEFTQVLNNGELVSLVGQSTTQINNQIQQISQLATQIQNQLKIYQNMLQNTAQLPSHVWGQVEGDLKQLQSVVNQGQGIAFSMGNIDDVLKQRFQSYAQFKTNLPNGANFASTYQAVVHEPRHHRRHAPGRGPHLAAIFDRGHHDGATQDRLGERRRPDESSAGWP